MARPSPVRWRRARRSVVSAPAGPSPIPSATALADERRAGHARHGHGVRRLPASERRSRRAMLRAKQAVHAVADSAPARAGVLLLTRLMPEARVQLTRYEAPIARLPRHLDGLRVLHLSDLHVHPGSDLAWQVPDLVATVEHDLLCYTGDFIDIDADIPSVAALLARMPRTAPTYAVLGNHDYIPFGRIYGSNDAPRLRTVLAEAGLTVLANEARPVLDGALYVVGVDDPSTGRDHLAQAMAEAPEEACTLALAHSPDVVLRLGRRQPDLILAGHTHGGQIRLPVVGALQTLSRLPRHLAMGLNIYQGVPLFVSRGIGYSGLNLRLGSPPEAAVLTLRAAPRVAVL